MLKYLKISNLAVIEEASVEVGSAFICLTGESGTGKSVLIDALLLLGGARGASDLVRTGSAKAVVEAEFELETVPDHLELLEGKELYLRRELTSEGKSRAFVNGVMVPNSILSEYGDIAFEIHGQHGQQRLLKAKNHLLIFDEQTGLSHQRQGFQGELENFRKRFHAYWEAKDGEARRLKDIDFLQLQIGEIEAVNPGPEDEELELRLKKARNREKIRVQYQELSDILQERLIPEARRASRLLTSLAEFVPDLHAYREQIDPFSATLEDLQMEIEGQDQEVDEDQLSLLEARETELNKLFLKYGRDIEEVREELARLKTELDRLSLASKGLEEEWRGLQKAYEALKNERRGLLDKRREAVVFFRDRVTRGLHELSLDGAVFDVSLQWPDWPEQLPATRDLRLPQPELFFLFSSNPGEEPKPLSKVASGGELSRLLLALIGAFEHPSGQLLVFDEVDAGLGGETAHAVGEKLASLGKSNQILCVTHFAQVARFATQQIKIGKTVRGGRTFTSLILCDYEERVSELARLMGGDSQSETLRKHARQMMDLTAEARGGG